MLVAIVEILTPRGRGAGLLRRPVPVALEVVFQVAEQHSLLGTGRQRAADGFSPDTGRVPDHAFGLAVNEHQVLVKRTVDAAHDAGIHATGKGSADSGRDGAGREGGRDKGGGADGGGRGAGGGRCCGGVTHW